MVRNNGMTILEVLFAIMIVTIGLLGAIAVFPVANQAARKGRINDEVTIAGNTVTHKFDAQYMRRPDHWIAYVDGSQQNPQVQATAYNGSALPTAFPSAFWKTSYCLDPRFTAANIGIAHGIKEQNWTYFPAYPQSAGSPRMQRITLTAGPGAGAMGRFQADAIFGIEDELVSERSKDGSIPAYQLYSPIKDPANPLYPKPGKREEDGRMTWMATLCPKVDRNSVTTGQTYGVAADNYLLSIVIFYSRLPSLTTRDFNIPISPPFAEDRWPDHEWTVSISGLDFYGTGNGGGEVRLNADYAEKLAVKSGDWVMLGGNADAPVDNKGKPIAPFSTPVFKWYRITDVDDIDTATINNVTRYVRNVTLVGPDWDTYDSDRNGVRDDAEVTIMPGIVSVLERTVRLEVDGNGY